ncbi:disease resistance protein Pik-2-like [Miscanthus floridulus]|uniref:disease resistance protein Pik-2-like n=1 Tax=Miscanthus floridulus TaxID=154761 RepID=UPI003457DEE6
MSVVTGALGSLAPKLLQLLHGEYKLQKGVRKQVQWLHSELESIHAFLRKVAAVPWDRLDELVKVWAREVREASYDMEDVLDTFLVRVDGAEPADPSRLRRAMKKLGELFTKAKARRDIAGAIDDIKKHLDEVAERRQKYKLDEMIMSKSITSASTIDPRLTAMYKEVSQLIGVDKSRDELISMLNLSQPDDDAPDKKTIKKVSIVGVGGLGKTTLAKAVYDKLKSQYDCGAFVSVGRDHDLVKVFKDILFDLDKNRYENIHNTGRGVDLLIREVREFLENKRYFIVIDDVWEVRTWEAIELALVENNHGSKVITTTRNVEVAKASGEVYKLKQLSNDDSMKLFYTRLSRADRKFLDNHPDDITEKILKKCAGIPLAIITMASLLAGKPECEWSMVYNSIGFHTTDNREAEDTMTILSFSYYDLPPDLRTCLLYLSTYPEDYLIQKDSLIWKWIAEGFIDGKQGTRLFELGERYFNDLINRSLIQPVESLWDGRVESCRVHDMVLDLMRKLSSDENFIAILGNNVEGTPAPSIVRRLANQNRIAEHINSETMVTGMPKVRSYTAFKCFIDSPDQFLRFKLLRVLDIVYCSFEKGCHLEHLGDLLHLRYLRIRFNGSSLELPIQLGNLKLLQTLDVQGTLPASIVHLTELLWLCADGKVPDGIGKLVSLEELRIFFGCSDKPKRFVKELASLRELRVLVFGTQGADESMQRDFVESLSNLQKIQHINVHGSAWHADTAMWEAAGFVLPRPLHYLGWQLIRFSKLPSCINPTRLPNLAHLALFVITMDEQDLKLLARLPTLCYLNLTTKSTVTASNINSSDRCFFQKLRYFETDAMVQFEQPDEEDTSVSLHMWNGEDALPFASRKNNDSRKVVPSGVMPNLEVLEHHVRLRALRELTGGNYSDYCGNIGLEYMPSLRELRGWIISRGLPAWESDDALVALRDACNVHPNHPTFGMHGSF